MFGHNQTIDICTEVNVENPQWWEKPRQPTGCRMHYKRGIQQRGKTQRQRPLVLFFATRGGYKMEENDLSLSLYVHTLCNYLYKITTTQSMCPKSYLYIYDFRDIYIYVHTNRSDRSEPDLGSAGSLYLPSGGTCFPTNSPFTSAWDVAPIRSASGMLLACRVSAPWSTCLTCSR